MPTRHQEGTSESHRFETPDRTCLLRVRIVLYNVMGSEHKIVHAYNVSGRSCRISRVGNYRSYMPTRYQEVTSGSHGVALSPGLGTQDRTCLQGIRTGLQDLMGSTNKIVHAYIVLGRGCRISRVWNNRSNMPSRYKDGVARSHGFRTSDSTCPERIRTGLQDLTGKKHQIEHAYKVSGRSYRISRVGNIVHAY